jgi:serine/threonine-protein kinase
MSLAAPDLGPYTLGPKIGGGGMASVYLGKYAAPPGEEAPPDQEIVALKVIKGDFVKNPEYEKMFLDEAQILTQLSHPNVIRTVGYGAQAGAWFIAMELLLGRSLLDLYEAALKSEKKIPIDVAAHIAREIARGLEHAHALVDEEDGHHLGIVHRDVNPSNVFIGYDGTVKLIDFGLAKARKRQTQSTQGLIKGKIPYLSPEQIKEDKLDGRSDVYALGTTLWEIAAMKRLFKKETDVATVRAIQKGDIPDLRTTIEKFPDALWAIIEKSLKQDREQRYADAAAMAKELDAFLAKKKDLAAKLAKLVEDLFPGEREKQEQWLSEATGKERKTFTPFVPIAEVPEVEQSVPLMPPPPEILEEVEPEPASVKEPEPEPEPVPEPEAEAEPDVAPKKSSSIVAYALMGAIAGALAIAAWAALMRH